MPEEKGESLQTAFPLYILAEGGDIVDGKRIGVLMECSGAERRQNDNLLIPYAHKGKSSDNLLDRSLDRALMCSGGVSESSRVCLQSLKSRLCAGNRWLPSVTFAERLRGQVPLYIYNEARHDVSGL